MIPSSGCPPWPPDHPRTLPRTGTHTPPQGARPKVEHIRLHGIGHGQPSVQCQYDPFDVLLEPLLAEKVAAMVRYETPDLEDALRYLLVASSRVDQGFL